MEMNVSPVSRRDGKACVYVRFTDGDKSAEGIMPEGRMLSNSGFTTEELEVLTEYMKSEKKTIISMAKKINVMDAFMGRTFQRDEKHNHE